MKQSSKVLTVAIIVVAALILFSAKNLLKQSDVAGLNDTLSLRPTFTQADGRYTKRSDSVQVPSAIQIGKGGTKTLIDSTQLKKIPYILDSRDAVLTYSKAQIDSFNYVFPLVFTHSSIASPADGATQYFGTPIGLAATAGAAARQFELPFACTLIGFSSTIFSGTPGSNETYTINVRKNNTTDYPLSSSFAADSGTKYLSASNLNVTFSATDKFEIKAVFPTWGTNPANVVHSITLFFKTAKQ